MDDRERLQWLKTQTRMVRRKTRGTLWGLTLIYAIPFLAVGLLTLLGGRPGIAAGSMALALPTVGMLRLMTAPPRTRRVTRRPMPVAIPLRVTNRGG